VSIVVSVSYRAVAWLRPIGFALSYSGQKFGGRQLHLPLRQHFGLAGGQTQSSVAQTQKPPADGHV
jgi:hypothetical protein